MNALASTGIDLLLNLIRRSEIGHAEGLFAEVAEQVVQGQGHTAVVRSALPSLGAASPSPLSSQTTDASGSTFAISAIAEIEESLEADAGEPAGFPRVLVSGTTPILGVSNFTI
jgi:hypothetical protein